MKEEHPYPSDIITEEQEQLLMKNELKNRRNHLYQDRETQTDRPKDLRRIHSAYKQIEPLRRLHGAQKVGTHGRSPENPEEKRLDPQTLRNLDGIRRPFTAEVGQFGPRDGYNAKRVEKVLLKEITIKGFGKIQQHQQWLNLGKWTHGIQTGDTIEFTARLEHGRPKYITEVRLRKNGSENARTWNPRSTAPYAPIQLIFL